MTEFYASSESNEWYTPIEYIELVKAVMGSIELDPASNRVANQYVGAERFFTKEEDGLERSWKAETVFCNPPYGRIGNQSSQGKWLQKFIGAYASGSFDQGIFLCNASIGDSWFVDAWYCDAVCLLHKRIRFYIWDEKDQKVYLGEQPTKGNALIYLGKDPSNFSYVLNTHGKVILNERHM